MISIITISHKLSFVNPSTWTNISRHCVPQWGPTAFSFPLHHVSQVTNSRCNYLNSLLIVHCWWFREAQNGRTVPDSHRTLIHRDISGFEWSLNSCAWICRNINKSIVIKICHDSSIGINLKCERLWVQILAYLIFTTMTYIYNIICSLGYPHKMNLYLI